MTDAEKRLRRSWATYKRCAAGGRPNCDQCIGCKAKPRENRP